MATTDTHCTGHCVTAYAAGIDDPETMPAGTIVSAHPTCPKHGTPDSPEAQDFWAGVEVIHRYSRAQAIEDGVLVDVSETAQEAGFKYPVAMTSALYSDAVAWDKRNTALQDVEGRLWDVLSMAFFAIRASRTATDRLTATVLRVPNTRRATVPRKLAYTVHIGPGDDPEPVITLMLPGED